MRSTSALITRHSWHSGGVVGSVLSGRPSGRNANPSVTCVCGIYYLVISVTYSLIYSPSYPITHPPVQWFTCPLAHSPNHPFIQLPTHLPIHLLTHSTTHSFTQLPTHLPPHLPTHSLIHSLTHLLTYPPTHSPTHSLTGSPIQLYTHSVTQLLICLLFHQPNSLTDLPINSIHLLPHSPAHSLLYRITRHSLWPVLLLFLNLSCVYVNLITSSSISSPRLMLINRNWLVFYHLQAYVWFHDNDSLLINVDQ